MTNEPHTRPIVRAPAGGAHDFANDTDVSAGFLNIYVPGGFERDIPAVVDWSLGRGANPRVDPEQTMN